MLHYFTILCCLSQDPDAISAIKPAVVSVELKSSAANNSSARHPLRSGIVIKSAKQSMLVLTTRHFLADGVKEVLGKTADPADADDVFDRFGRLNLKRLLTDGLLKPGNYLSSQLRVPARAARGQAVTISLHENADTADGRVVYLAPESPWVLIHATCTAPPTSIRLVSPKAEFDPEQSLFLLGVIPANGTQKSVKVLPSKVAQVQNDQRGQLDVLQLTDEIAEEMIGGPVLNTQGQLVGVISSRFSDSKRGQALSYVRLWELLNMSALGSTFQVDNFDQWADSSGKGDGTGRVMIDLLPIRQDCKSASLMLRLMKRTKITELPDFAMLDDTFEVPLEINELTGVGTFPMPPIEKYVPIVMQAKVVGQDGHVSYGPIERVDITSAQQQRRLAVLTEIALKEDAKAAAAKATRAMQANGSAKAGDAVLSAMVTNDRQPTPAVVRRTTSSSTEGGSFEVEQKYVTKGNRLYVETTTKKTRPKSVTKRALYEYSRDTNHDQFPRNVQEFIHDELRLVGFQFWPKKEAEDGFWAIQPIYRNAAGTVNGGKTIGQPDGKPIRVLAPLDYSVLGITGKHKGGNLCDVSVIFVSPDRKLITQSSPIGQASDGDQFEIILSRPACGIWTSTPQDAHDVRRFGLIGFELLK